MNKKERGSTLILVMFVLLGISLIVSGLSDILSSSYSRTSLRLYKVEGSDEVVNVGWSYIITHIDDFFKGESIYNDVIDLSDQSSPFNMVDGILNITVFNMEYDPISKKFDELKGLTSLPPGTDPSLLKVYIYSVVLTGKLGSSSSSAPSLRVNIFVKQYGLNNGAVD